MNKFEFNKSDYRLLFMYFVISVSWLTFRYISEEYTNFEIVTGLVGFVLKTAVLIYIISWSIKKYVIDKKNYALFFLFTFSSLAFIGFLDLLRDYYTSDPPWRWNLSLDFILVQSFYNSTPDMALPFGLILGKKYYENKLDNVELRNTQKELELKVLRAQFDPHFLYNNLNTIDALIDYSPKERVKEYISHLAALYRYLINTKDEDVVTLEDEITLAKNYFYLIETRFENDYSFKIIEKKKPKAGYLPNGALLTVLENVVKHNKALDGNTIDTEIGIEENGVYVTNTKGLSNSKDEFLGTGLQNLDKRYHLLSNKKIKVDETEQTFTIRLPLLKVVD